MAYCFSWPALWLFSGFVSLHYWISCKFLTIKIHLIMLGGDWLDCPVSTESLIKLMPAHFSQLHFKRALHPKCTFCVSDSHCLSGLMSAVALKMWYLVCSQKGRWLDFTAVVSGFQWQLKDKQKQVSKQKTSHYLTAPRLCHRKSLQGFIDWEKEILII